MTPARKSRQAADEIDYLAVDGVEIHPADRKIAAADVFFNGAVADSGGTAAVNVGGVGAEGRDLEWFAVDDDHDHAELRAYRDSMFEEVLDDFGTGVGGDIVILGGYAEDAIADASASQVGGEARLAQFRANRDGLVFLDARSHAVRQVYRLAGEARYRL